MKRLLSVMLVFLLMIGSLGNVVYADDIYDAKVAEIASMMADELGSFENKQELYDFVILYKSVTSGQQMFNAYWDSFVLLADNFDNYDRNIGDESVKEITLGFVDLLADDTFLSNAQLEMFLLHPTRDADGDGTTDFEQFLIDEIAPEIYDILIVMDYGVNDLNKGISFLNRAFTLMNSALVDTILDNDNGYSKAIFEANYTYDPTLELDRGEAKDIIQLGNAVTGRDIVTDYEAALDQMEKMVVYYNGLSTSDQKLVFDYLSDYGFIKLVDAEDNSSTTVITQTRTNTVYVPAVSLLNIDETIIPQSPFGFFSDLASFSWAQTAIQRLFMFGIINGVVSPSFTWSEVETERVVNEEVVSRTYMTKVFAGEEGQYAPSNLVTRAEFAAMMVRLMADDEAVAAVVGDRSFPTDIEATDWYYDVVMYAYDQGFLIYRDETTQNIDPNEQITREEIAYALSVILEENGYTVDTFSANTILSKFEDAADISDDMVLPMALVVDQGIVQGSGVAGSYYCYPQEHATRAEAAVMMFRIASLVDTNVYINPEVTEGE